MRKIIASLVAVLALTGGAIATAQPASAVNGVRHAVARVNGV